MQLNTNIMLDCAKKIKEFKEIFQNNIIYPPLFGKTKLKKENLVSAMLEQKI